VVDAQARGRRVDLAAVEERGDEQPEIDPAIAQRREGEAVAGDARVEIAAGTRRDR